MKGFTSFDEFNNYVNTIAKTVDLLKNLSLSLVAPKHKQQKHNHSVYVFFLDDVKRPDLTLRSLSVGKTTKISFSE